MWSEPFIINTLLNEEVAVFLMDAQGAFDTNSGVKDYSALFALSLMVSSMQIYNLSQNINEDDLQYLQLFADYGRIVFQETKVQPFQVLSLEYSRLN
jgi:atlastin